jgi:hypothetical protein
MRTEYRGVLPQQNRRQLAADMAVILDRLQATLP